MEGGLLNGHEHQFDGASAAEIEVNNDMKGLTSTQLAKLASRERDARVVAERKLRELEEEMERLKKRHEAREDQWLRMLSKGE